MAPMIYLTIHQLDEIKRLAGYRKHLEHQATSLNSNFAAFNGINLTFRADGGKIDLQENSRGKLVTAMLAAAQKHLTDEIREVNAKLADLGIAIE